MKKHTWQNFFSEQFSQNLYKKSFSELTNKEQNTVLDMVKDVKTNQEQEFPGFWDKGFVVED